MYSRPWIGPMVATSVSLPPAYFNGMATPTRTNSITPVTQAMIRYRVSARVTRTSDPPAELSPPSAAAGLLSPLG